MNTSHKATTVRAAAVLLLFIGLIAGLGALSSSLAAAPEPPPEINILAIGDSNTYGFSYVEADDPQPAGWPKKADRYPQAWAGEVQANKSLASYRLPLYQLLKRQSTYSFGLVGNEYSTTDKSYSFGNYPSGAGYAIPNNPATELAFVGWPSKTTVDVNGSNAKWGLSTALDNLTGDKVPNVALIHLGTNDINQGKTDLTLSAMDGLVTKLTDKNSNIRIYVALIIPTGYPGQYCDDNGNTDPFGNGLRTFAANCAPFAYTVTLESPVEAFNRQLVEWCRPKQETPGTGFNTRRCDAADLKDKSVYLVDQYAGFDRENWLLPSDEVHLTRHGECQVARRWYEALRETKFPNLPAPPDGFCSAYDEGYVAPAPAGIVSRVSVHSSGVQQFTGGMWQQPSVSANGRYVAFISFAGDLVPFDSALYRFPATQDYGNCDDVFVHDRTTGQTIRVSVDSAGNEADYVSEHPVISDNGRFVVFESEATNLVEGDIDYYDDIFVHDLQTGQTERVSVDSQGNQGNFHSERPDISSDGRYVTFQSSASNLVPNDDNNRKDIFVHDRTTNKTTLVSVSASGAQADDASGWPSISADGSLVAFESSAGNLVIGDTNELPDIFVRDINAGTTSRISVSSAGNQGDGWSQRPAISGDGRYVAFISDSSNLAGAGPNEHYQLFVHDRETHTTVRLSNNASGEASNEDADSVAISYDGQLIVYESAATDLVSGDTNGSSDVFVSTLSGETYRTSVDSSGNQVNQSSDFASISADGRFVAFRSDADKLVAGDTNDFDDLFIRELSDLLPTPPPTATPEPTATTSATSTPSPTPTATPTATPSSTPMPPGTVFGEVVAGPGGGHVEHKSNMVQDGEVFELDPDEPVKLVGDVGVDYFVECADGKRRFLSQENFAATGNDSEVLFVPPLVVDCPSAVAGRQVLAAPVTYQLLAGGVLNAVHEQQLDLTVETEWASVTAAGKNEFAVGLSTANETIVTAYRGEVSIAPTNPALPVMPLAAGEEVAIGADAYGPVTYFTFDLYLPAISAIDGTTPTGRGK